MEELRQIETDGAATGLRIAIVVSQYNGAITNNLRDGAIHEFIQRGGSPGDLLVISAPGAFELPVLAAVAAQRADIDAVVALGCLIRGETRHDQVIGDSVARSLAELSMRTVKAIAFGLLTVDTYEQAQARSQPIGDVEARSISTGNKHSVSNKGIEAMGAAVETARLLKKLRIDAAGPV